MAPNMNFGHFWISDGVETKLGISPELMEEYNEYVREHNGRIKESASR